MLVVLLRRMLGLTRTESARRPGLIRDRLFTPVQAFGGSCILTAALLLPHLRPVLVGEGLALAVVVRWMWRRYHP